MSARLSPLFAVDEVGGLLLGTLFTSVEEAEPAGVEEDMLDSDPSCDEEDEKLDETPGCDEALDFASIELEAISPSREDKRRREKREGSTALTEMRIGNNIAVV